jgi:DinB superfamily
MDERTEDAAQAADERPAKVLLLAAQLDTSREIFDQRLKGLTDDEYMWEPVPGAWSLRRPGEVRTGSTFGRGAVLMEYERPEPDPPPLRTIAWLVAHMVEMLRMRHDYTLGSHSLTMEDLEWPATADAAIAALDQATTRWRSVFDLVPAAELDQVGRSDYPHGLDPELPLIDILWWMNREYIHHTAEIAFIRDLYAWTRGR